jgi:hypothetical protein
MAEKEREKVTVIRKGRRPKRLRKDTKYQRKFTRELLSGIRYKEGLSQVELCHRWRICKKTFADWVESIPEFKKAYDISKSDYAAYWQEINKKTASGELKGNAACITFALTNIEDINWSTKVDVKCSSDDEVRKITIELLQPKHKEITNNTIDAKPIEQKSDEVIANDVIKLIGTHLNAKRS